MLFATKQWPNSFLEVWAEHDALRKRDHLERPRSFPSFVKLLMPVSVVSTVLKCHGTQVILTLKRPQIAIENIRDFTTVIDNQASKSNEMSDFANRAQFSTDIDIWIN